MNAPVSTDGTTTPPANLEAEQALLGAILINNQALERVSHLVTAADFHHDAHRRIFQAIEALVARDDRADPVTLKAYFSDTDLDYVGGTRYFATLASAASIGESLIHYAKVVREFSVRRQLLQIATRAYAAAGQFDAEVELDEILGDVKKQIDDLAENTGDTIPVVWLGEATQRGIDLLDRAHRGEMAGVPTGIAALDAKLGGLKPGHLILLAARPSMGKTSLALYIGLYAGKWIAKQVEANPSFRSSVLVISCEMKEEELGQRSLAESSSVAYQEMSTGRVSQDEFQRIFLAQRDLQKIPVAFIAQTGLKMSRIRAAIRQHKRRYGCCLVIIDYIGLLKGDGVYRAGNRVAELSEITEGLKAMAGHFDIPVLALAQLNRDLAKREDKRPQLHDLRDSGSLEQDADEVIFLHRDQYYLERSQPELGSDAYTKWLADMERVNGIAELIIAKNRHGGVGTVRCRIDLATNRFFAEDHQPDVRQSGFDWTSEPPVQTG